MEEVPEEPTYNIPEMVGAVMVEIDAIKAMKIALAESIERVRKTQIILAQHGVNMDFPILREVVMVEGAQAQVTPAGPGIQVIGTPVIPPLGEDEVRGPVPEFVEEDPLPGASGPIDPDDTDPTVLANRDPRNSKQVVAEAYIPSSESDQLQFGNAMEQQYQNILQVAWGEGDDKIRQHAKETFGVNIPLLGEGMNLLS